MEREAWLEFPHTYGAFVDFVSYGRQMSWPCKRTEKTRLGKNRLF